MFPIKLPNLIFLLCVLTLGLIPWTCVVGQDDDSIHERSEIKNPFTSTLSKMFQRGQSSPNATETPEKLTKPRSTGIPSKPAADSNRGRPVQATQTGTRGGLLVPLRSFTNRVFRGNEEPKDEIKLEMPDAAISPNMPTRSSEPPIDPSANSSSNSGVSTKKTVEPFSQPAKPKPESYSLPRPTQKSDSYVGAPAITAPRPSSIASAPTKSETKRPTLPPSSSLEEKSTSRRNPDGFGDQTGIEATKPILPNPGPRPNGKPTNLLDLSIDSPTIASQAEKPSSVSSRNPKVPTAPSSEYPTSSSQMSSSEQGIAVSRNRVPEPKLDMSSSSIDTSPANLKSNPATQSPDTRSTSGAYTAPRVGSDSSNGSTRLLEMQQPGIRINIQGPNAVVVGQESIYEVVAKNEGSFDVDGLVIRVSLPKTVAIGRSIANVGTVQPDQEDSENAILWDLEKLAATEQQTLRIPIQTSTTENFALGVEWTTIPQTRDVQIQVQQPKLDIALEGPSEAEFGAPLNYRIRIKNPGNATAKAVEVLLSAETFGSNQSVIGDILPGTERVIDVELLFQQDGVIPIVASATSPVSKLQAASNINVTVRQAKIVAKWDGPSAYYQGSLADYKLVLSNNGDAPVTNAKCSIELPQGTESSLLPPGATRRGNIVQWDVKRLAPNETLSFPLRLTFSQLGQSELTFHSETKNGIKTVSAFPVLVDAVEDLKLTVVSPLAPAPVGQQVSYDIEIHNRGNKAAKLVTVSTQFSDGIEPTRFEGHTGQLLTGQVVFDAIPTIAPNAKVTLKIFANAAQAGVHRFRAEVKCASGEADLVQEGSTRYLATGATANDRR